MTEYDFTLRYSLASQDENLDHLVDRLHEAGCDDALIGLGGRGRLALDFTRESSSAFEAVSSATAAVRQAAPAAVLIEVAPDLVGASEVADLVGCSRQNIRQLMLGNWSSAPAPVHEGRQILWHLAEVLDWLTGDKGYSAGESLRDVARVAMQFNLAINSDGLEAGKRQEILSLIR